VKIFLTLVVKDSKVLKAVNPGQSIRYELHQKGLFEPLSIESWTEKYMVAPVELGGDGSLWRTIALTLEVVSRIKETAT